MDIEWLTGVIKENFREYCGIEDVTVKTYDWIETLSADKYVKLLRTYSGFRGMDDELRGALNRDIRVVIENSGGNIQQPYRVVLFHARMEPLG